MSASKLDAVYRSILITKFFTKGWGKPDNLRRLFEFRKVVSNREECYKLVPSDYPVTITKEVKGSDCHILEGHFLTPMETFLPGVVPPCAHRAHFQVIMPTKWADSDAKPMCVHLAGTGDHYFWRRRNLMAKPLMKEAGIGAIILENPFYGLRKPQDQVRSSLHNVSDIFVMGGCLILETLVLLHWCERNGLGPLGVTGLSMGGHMASLAATNWPKPLVLVPCLSWSTASAVFTQGVMSDSINWELLESQFFSDGQYRDKLAKMVTIVDEAFLAGRKFAQRFSKNETKSSVDANSFNLPNILNTTDPSIKTFDITNPNNLSSCQGLYPEVNQKYSVISNDSKVAETVHNVTSLECLKTDNKISVNLYTKITSDARFELEPSEIDELNRIAFKNVDKALNAKATQKNDTESTSGIVNSENITDTKNCTQNITAEPNSIKCTSDINSTEVNKNICESKNIITSDTGLDKDGKFAEKNSNSSRGDSVESKIITNIMIDSDGDAAIGGEKKKPSRAAKNLLSSIPFLSKSKEVAKVNVRNREALQFMRGVMDECTHLGNFTVPFDTSLIIAVCAKNDAYVPRGDTGALEELWPGAEVRYINAGHVSAYVLHQSMFRSCIAEAFQKSKAKWSEGKHDAKQ